jgi:hypothetical protein
MFERSPGRASCIRWPRGDATHRKDRDRGHGRRARSVRSGHARRRGGRPSRRAAAGPAGRRRPPGREAARAPSRTAVGRTHRRERADDQGRARLASQGRRAAPPEGKEPAALPAACQDPPAPAFARGPRACAEHPRSEAAGARSRPARDATQAEFQAPGARQASSTHGPSACDAAGADSGPGAPAPAGHLNAAAGARGGSRPSLGASRPSLGGSRPSPGRSRSSSRRSRPCTPIARARPSPPPPPRVVVTGPSGRGARGRCRRSS